MKRWELHHADCRDAMRTMEAESVDAIVTDPPYGLSFMGREWDHGVPGVEFWREALRVAKPGAHLVAFGGTRTFHRLACAIEDAGWEVRDCLSWLYGSGFPKSLDVSKAIDKLDATDEQERRRFKFTAWVRSTGATARQIDEATGTRMGNHYTTHPTQPAIMTREHLDACRHLLGDVPEWIERECEIRSVESANFASREVIGKHDESSSPGGLGGERFSFVNKNITAPATDAARAWHGWGTALKPAWEPIILARKPLDGTVAANVLAHGTGALNIDATRIATDDNLNGGAYAQAGTERHDGAESWRYKRDGGAGEFVQPSGRWPANVALDEEAAAMLGEPSRFFYCAKASRSERGEANTHPTVKPTALMRWLVRLVCPPGGLVLDPFNGSGSTGVAALAEGMRYVGCEREAEYVEISRRRLEDADRQVQIDSR